MSIVVLSPDALRPTLAASTTMVDVAKVSIVMAGAAEWEILRHAAETLDSFGVPYETHVAPPHQAAALVAYLKDAESRGAAVVIAASSGGTSLAALCSAHTLLPVLGVPLPGPHLAGFDSLLATVQAPPHVPVATLALGKAGATNAALLAVAILANFQPQLRVQLETYRAELAAKVLDETLPPTT